MKKWLTKTIINIFCVIFTVILFFSSLSATVFLLNAESRDFDFSRDFYLNNLEEYNAFVADNDDLPKNFVTAEMLSFLGEFERLWFYDINNLNDYRYQLLHSSGETILFGVHEHPRDHDDRDARYRDVGLLRYHYIDNHLISVEWMSNGVFYEINDDLPSGTTLAQLLSKFPENQQEALDLFPDFIGNATPIAFADLIRSSVIPGVWIIFFFACFLIWRCWKGQAPIDRKDGIKL